MGVNLIVEVLDLAPPDLSAIERLVLIALAEKARDDTRAVLPSRIDRGRCEACSASPAACSESDVCCAECHHPEESPRDTLRRRTGLSEPGLSDVLRRLAKKGLDVRHQIATGKSGKPVYSMPGRATSFVIPTGMARQTPEHSEISTRSGDDRTIPVMVRQTPTNGPVITGPAEREWSDNDRTLVPQSLTHPSAARAPERDSPVRSGDTLDDDVRRVAAELLAKLGPELDEDTAIRALIRIRSKKDPDDLGRYTARFTVADLVRWASPAPRRSRDSQSVACPKPGHSGNRFLDADGDPNCPECASPETVRPVVTRRAAQQPSNAREAS